MGRSPEHPKKVGAMFVPVEIVAVLCAKTQPGRLFSSCGHRSEACACQTRVALIHNVWSTQAHPHSQCQRPVRSGATGILQLPNPQDHIFLWSQNSADTQLLFSSSLLSTTAADTVCPITTSTPASSTKLSETVPGRHSNDSTLAAGEVRHSAQRRQRGHRKCTRTLCCKLPSPNHCCDFSLIFRRSTIIFLAPRDQGLAILLPGLAK
jgi:hypothetical protein